jgi:DNA-directed RNA polymerase subunit RPC12/RpoP
MFVLLFYSFICFQGSAPIRGANTPELHLFLSCPLVGNRAYRCIKCKMVSREVPGNAYHISCGNCGTKFAYKEVGCHFFVYLFIFHCQS